MSSISLKIGDKEITISTKVFENQEEIDIDKILRIDHNHLLAESLTFSVILNGLGMLMIDSEHKVKESKLDLEIWYSKERDRVRLSWDEDPERKAVRGAKYTMDQIKDAVESSAVYRMKKRKIAELEKAYGYMNTIYWSAKSKDQKLNSITSEIVKGELNFDEINGKKFNGVMISSKKKLIP